MQSISKMGKLLITLVLENDKKSFPLKVISALDNRKFVEAPVPVTV